MRSSRYFEVLDSEADGVGGDHRDPHRGDRVLRAEHSFPGYSEPVGFWFSAVLLVGLATGLWVSFRRRGRL